MMLLVGIEQDCCMHFGSLATGPAAKTKLSDINISEKLVPLIVCQSHLGLIQRNIQGNTLSCSGHGSVMLVETVRMLQTDS